MGVYHWQEVVVPQEIFGDVTRPPKGLGSQSWYTVPLSIVLHAVGIAIVVIVPLMATDVIPKPSSILTATVTPPPPPEPPLIPVAPRTATPVAPTTDAPPAAPSREAAPTTAGEKIGEEAPGPALPTTTGNVGPPGNAVGDASGTSVGVGIPQPPPPPVDRPIRPGAVVKYPEKLRDVRPHYPAIAVAGRVEGRVIIEAIIGIDGRVKDAKVLRSIALLDRAALEAVQQWRFTPTLLNGVPVPVIITVSVDFKLH